VATDLPIVLAPGDYDDGEFGGMKIGKGKRSTRRKLLKEFLQSKSVEKSWSGRRQHCKYSPPPQAGKL
jgi:hypothetical protein